MIGYRFLFLLGTFVVICGLNVLAQTPQPDAFASTVSSLPPEQQIGAVLAKLKELNPNFDGKETHKIENGAVTALSFSTVGMTNISPVKALRWLRTLNIAPASLNQKGSLDSLAALQGMQLTWLWCHNNPISDLSPLKGMPLTVLSISGTQVSDLSPLAGMKLQVLSFNDTVISDISPLEGMPITTLWCHNTKIIDLTPLKSTPIKELKCDFVAERDAPILREIKSLVRINDKPAAQFWIKFITTSQSSSRSSSPQQKPQEVTKPITVPESSVSAKEQIRRFIEKMKDLNPAYNDTTAKLDYTSTGNRVTELTFKPSGVTDLSPIRMFPHLEKLNLNVLASDNITPVLSDISPLNNLNLKSLGLYNSKVQDLSPVLTLKHLRMLVCPGGRFLTDLSILNGLKLEYLSCENCGIDDIEFTRDMPLLSLFCSRTRVKDLSPLKGKRLSQLHIEHTDISDISVLKGMPLLWLFCHKTKVTDFSTLKTLPNLQQLTCDFVAERDTKILRSIKSLQRINELPASEFWKLVDAGESPQAK